MWEKERGRGSFSISVAHVTERALSKGSDLGLACEKALRLSGAKRAAGFTG